MPPVIDDNDDDFYLFYSFRYSEKTQNIVEKKTTRMIFYNKIETSVATMIVKKQNQCKQNNTNTEQDDEYQTPYMELNHPKTERKQIGFDHK